MKKKNNFLTANWRNLIMLNYPVHPESLKSYLPKGVELDLYDGTPYVSLVGFLFENTRILGLRVPFLRTFEEINLQFYVVRKMKSEIRRGIVFIQDAETGSTIRRLANSLYNEHYTALPTRHVINRMDKEQEILYWWKVKRRWNSMAVRTGLESKPITAGSMEEFIFDHYYGYTRINKDRTIEYHISHPRWLTNDVKQFELDCNFTATYGLHFGSLQLASPASIMYSEGSPISIKWKKYKI